MPAFNKRAYLQGLPLAPGNARFFSASSSFGRVQVTRNFQNYANAPTRTEHVIAILAHVVGVPGNGCARRVTSQQRVVAGGQPRAMAFEDEIVFLGTDPKGNRILSKCTTCVFASDGGACGSLPRQGPWLPPPPPPAPLVQAAPLPMLQQPAQAQAQQNPPRPSRNVQQPQHARHISGASEDSLGSATSFHFNLAGRQPSPDPDYQPGRPIGPSNRPNTRRRGQPPPRPQPHQRDPSEQFYDAPGSPMRDIQPTPPPQQLHGIPGHLRTFGVREFSPVPTEGDPRLRQLTARNLRRVPGVDIPAEWGLGDTTGYLEEDQTRSEYQAQLDESREAALRDINSRRRAMARARVVGIDTVERELEEELQRVLQEQSDDAFASKMREFDWMHGRRKDDDDRDRNGGGGGFKGGEFNPGPAAQARAAAAGYRY